MSVTEWDAAWKCATAGDAIGYLRHMAQHDLSSGSMGRLLLSRCVGLDALVLQTEDGHWVSLVKVPPVLLEVIA